MSTHNIGFYEDLTKIIFELSSNIIISSTKSVFFICLKLTKNQAHAQKVFKISFFQNEPRYEKTGLRGFRPGPTQTGLYSHRRWLEA